MFELAETPCQLTLTESGVLADWLAFCKMCADQPAKEWWLVPGSCLCQVRNGVGLLCTLLITPISCFPTQPVFRDLNWLSYAECFVVIVSVLFFMILTGSYAVCFVVIVSVLFFMILTGSYAVCFVVIASVLFFMILIGSYTVCLVVIVLVWVFDGPWWWSWLPWWLPLQSLVTCKWRVSTFLTWNENLGDSVYKRKEEGEQKMACTCALKERMSPLYMTLLHPAPVSAYLEWKSHKRHSFSHQCLLNQIKGKVNLCGCLWKWSKGCDKGTSSTAHVWLLDSRACYSDQDNTWGFVVWSRIPRIRPWIGRRYFTLCAQNWKVDKGSCQLHQIVHKIDTVLNRCHPENFRDATAETWIALMTITRHTSKWKERKFH